MRGGVGGVAGSQPRRYTVQLYTNAQVNFRDLTPYFTNDQNLCLMLSFQSLKCFFYMFSRVTMKMDVSYTDHSHIIGKGGNTIRRVMAETNCHIHFPDSNRSNPNEKSNQVSIAGEMSGVERARYQLN